jgi:hypothetical protein
MFMLPVDCPVTNESCALDTDWVTNPVRLKEARNALRRAGEKIWFSDKVTYCDRLKYLSWTSGNWRGLVWCVSSMV